MVEAKENPDLPDYDEYDIDLEPMGSVAVNGAAAAATATGAAKPTTDNVGVHSTSFKDMVLRPELQQSIMDCGFEHPSDVQ